MNWLRKALAFTETEYLSSCVSMLTKSIKMIDTTKREFPELVFFQRDQKISQIYSRADLTSVSDTLTC